MKRNKLYRWWKGGRWAKLYGEWFQADDNGWIDIGGQHLVHMIYAKITEREDYRKIKDD